jgi:hypothetical protein
MWIFIIFLVLILLFATLQPKVLSIVVGGAQPSLKDKICAEMNNENKALISKWSGSIVNYDSFNKVDSAENLKIFDELFSSGVYNQYEARTNRSGCYEYIKHMATLGELDFSREDYIYDPSTPNKISAAPQNTKYNAKDIKSVISILYSDFNFNNDERHHRHISQLNSLAHIGKVKLFIADLQALIYLLPSDAVRRPNGEPKYTVIYIGSAPGHQTWMLADKFKNVKFILYDGAKFSDRLRNYSNVTLNNQYFGDDDIKKYKDKVDILISDVRLMIKGDVAETEIQVHKDMLMQQKWVIDIKPRLGSMLKFRPPYKIFKLDDDGIPESSDYTYLGGTVYWQTFPHIQSTEGRLLSTRADIERGPIPFNYEHYENAACEHNLRRVWCTYKPSLPDLIHFPGFDRCLDCSYLLFVLTEYVTKYEPNNNSPKTILNLLSFVTRNTKTLICSCEKTVYKPKLSLYIHGLWQNETRFEKHLRYLKMWMAREIAPEGPVT